MDISAQLPEAIEWSEGMLLSPQHMQQTDIYWSQQLRHLAASLQPYYWGLIDLDYDEKALADGIVSILRLHAVMPDGLVVQYPGPYDSPLRLDVKQAADAWQDGALRVYLAVPVRAEGAASSTSRIQRFDRVAGRLEVDEGNGESRMEVGRLRPRLSLLAGARVPAKFTVFPLLELVRDAGDHLRISKYHPPLLRLSASSFLPTEQQLPERLQTLATSMRNKLRDLVGARRVDDNEARLDTESRQQLFVGRQLAAGLPGLEVALMSRVCHPFDLYRRLADLAGELAAIGVNPTPPALDEYRHDHCLPGFETLLKFIQERLDLITPRYEAMLFDRVSDTSFTRRLPADMQPDTLVIELRPRENQTEAMLQRWISHAYIGSDDLLPVLQLRRLPGAVVRKIDPREVSGLNVADGAVLFEVISKSIDLDNKLTPVIRSDRALMVQGPSEGGAPREIVLHRSRLKSIAESIATTSDSAYPDQEPISDA